MTDNQILIKKFQITNGFKTSDFSVSRIIKDLYFQDKIKLLNIDKLQMIDDVNLKFDVDWSNYRNGFDIKSYLKATMNHLVIIEVKYYDCDNIHGIRKNPRWKAVFASPVDNLHLFAEQINFDFERYVDKEYTDEERKIQIDKKKIISDRLINSVNKHSLDIIGLPDKIYDSNRDGKLYPTEKPVFPEIRKPDTEFMSVYFPMFDKKIAEDITKTGRQITADMQKFVDYVSKKRQHNKSMLERTVQQISIIENPLSAVLDQILVFIEINGKMYQVSDKFLRSLDNVKHDTNKLIQLMANPNTSEYKGDNWNPHKRMTEVIIFDRSYWVMADYIDDLQKSELNLTREQKHILYLLHERTRASINPYNKN